MPHFVSKKLNSETVTLIVNGGRSFFAKNRKEDFRLAKEYIGEHAFSRVRMQKRRRSGPHFYIRVTGETGR